jgi:hypothetical protein
MLSALPLKASKLVSNLEVARDERDHRTGIDKLLEMLSTERIVRNDPFRVCGTEVIHPRFGEPLGQSNN